MPAPAAGRTWAVPAEFVPVLLAKHAEGWEGPRTAALVGRDRSTVRGWRVSLGLPAVRRADHPADAVTVERLVSEKNPLGWSDRAIAAALGVNPSTVSMARALLGLTPNYPGRRPGLQWEHEGYLRAATAAKVGVRTIAADLGVNPSTVKRWRRLRIRAAIGPWFSRHTRALIEAGWGWPIDGLPGEPGRRDARVLIALLAGPMTRGGVAAAIGYTGPVRRCLSGGPARGGRPAKPGPLAFLEPLGLVVRLTRTSTTADRFALTDAGLALLAGAAGAVAARTESAP